MSGLRQHPDGHDRDSPQIVASDPGRSAFVTANAGLGQDLDAGRPRRAAAAARRRPGRHPLRHLHQGGRRRDAASAVRAVGRAGRSTTDPALSGALGALGEPTSDLARARRLFARALETPGRLEDPDHPRLLRDAAEALPARGGRVADIPGAGGRRGAAGRRPRPRPAGRDRARRARWRGRAAPTPTSRSNSTSAASTTCSSTSRPAGAPSAPTPRPWATTAGAMTSGRAADSARRRTPTRSRRAALAEIDWTMWRRASDALFAAAAPRDQKLGAAMAAVDDVAGFEDVWALFATTDGAPLKDVCTRGFEPGLRAWLVAEQQRLGAALDQARAARVARDSCHAITLAVAYARLYDVEKARIGALDFADLIQAVARLLTVRADAAWVLYKLDGGIEHVLLDEAQDTAPEQWAILSDLTGEFFAGAGRPRREDAPPRTMFAVGDEKQSIYSFQGAKPERFDAEARRYRARIEGGGERFVSVPLEESRRSTEGVLAFVDAVFADPDAAAGLGPAAAARGPLHHVSTRDDSFGAVDIWPQTENDPVDAVEEWWTPVDARPGETAAKKLARRVAQTVKAMIADRVAVWDKGARADRAATAGDFLVLVRRRNALFHEIIRALKSEAVPTGGADRLALSEHVAFKDLMALGRFARFPADDLTLAALLRSPFCEVDQDGLFDLAYRRQGSLWACAEPARGRAPAVAGGAGFPGLGAGAGRRSPSVRLLQRGPQPDGRARSLDARAAAGPARARGGGCDRRLPRRGAGAGATANPRPGAVPGRDGADRSRGEARGRGQPGRGAGDDRARRQGARGADRHPARHHHARHAAGRPLARNRRRRLPLGAAQARRLPGVSRRPRAPGDGRRARESPPVLRRADPRARPADHRRRQAAAGSSNAAGTTWSPAPSGGRRSRRGFG